MSAPQSGSGRPASPASGARKTLVLLVDSPAAARLLAGLVVVLLLLAPMNLSGYWVRVLSYVFAMAALTQSYNLIVGLTGYPAFGHAAFFGTGAYTVAILMTKAHWSFWASLPMALLVPAALAGLLGYPLMRLKSSYFSVATIGVMYAMREIIINARDLTGGSQGLVVPSFFAEPRTMVLSFYYMMFAVMVLATLTIWLIMRSRFGYGLAAIRDDEDAAQVMGIPTVAYKITAWSMAAAMAGLAGGVYAALLGFLEAPNVFSIVLASQSFIMMLLGGMGTVIGPVLGAAFLQILSELVWGNLGQYNMFILGVLVVLVTMFMPAGIVELLLQTVRRLLRAGGEVARR